MEIITSDNLFTTEVIKAIVIGLVPGLIALIPVLISLINYIYKSKFRLQNKYLSICSNKNELISLEARASINLIIASIPYVLFICIYNLANNYYLTSLNLTSSNLSNYFGILMVFMNLIYSILRLIEIKSKISFIKIVESFLFTAIETFLLIISGLALSLALIDYTQFHMSLLLMFVSYMAYFLVLVISLKLSVKDSIGKYYDSIAIYAEGMYYPYYTKLLDYKTNHDSIMIKQGNDLVIIQKDRIITQTLFNSKNSNDILAI